MRREAREAHSKEEAIRRQQEKERRRRDEDDGDEERRVASECSSGSQASSLLSLARQEGLKDSDEASQVASAFLVSSKYKAWPSHSAVVPSQSAVASAPAPVLHSERLTCIGGAYVWVNGFRKCQ